MKDFVGIFEHLNYIPLSESKFIEKTDFKSLNSIIAKDAIKILNDAKSFIDMSTFNVDSIDFYTIAFMRDAKLEIHFGVYDEVKFLKLVTARNENDKETMKEILKDPEFMYKDGETGYNKYTFLKVLSYVYSILKKILKDKNPTGIKISGTPRKFVIYKRLVSQLINEIPYYIWKEQDDFYTDKFNNKIPVKSIILMSNSSIVYH